MTPGVKRAIQVTVSVVLVGLIIWYVFRQFADVSDVWAVIRELSPGELAVLALVAAWNLVTYWIVVVVATWLKRSMLRKLTGFEESLKVQLPAPTPVMCRSRPPVPLARAAVLRSR